MTDKRTKKKLLECSEEMGLFFERMGGQRMAGRMIGWLVVSDEPHFTASDLARVLKASKGSISTITRQLEEGGLLERFTLPGERSAYFRLRPQWWVRLLERRTAVISQMRSMIERWLGKFEGSSAGRAERLTEMRAFYAFLEQELADLMERWLTERRREVAGDNR
jgi:DNA-binding transcriptional regulator GbsR (MarR family)